MQVLPSRWRRAASVGPAPRGDARQPTLSQIAVRHAPAARAGWRHRGRPARGRRDLMTRLQEERDQAHARATALPAPAFTARGAATIHACCPGLARAGGRAACRPGRRPGPAEGLLDARSSSAGRRRESRRGRAAHAAVNDAALNRAGGEARDTRILPQTCGAAGPLRLQKLDERTRAPARHRHAARAPCRSMPMGRERRRTRDSRWVGRDRGRRRPPRVPRATA